MERNEAFLTQIACLHGHFSNISLITDAFAFVETELVHYVDPGLLLQTEGKNTMTAEQSHGKLLDQLTWMQANHPDAIVITCTQYAACITDEDEAASPSPIFTIDRPFFHEIAYRVEPQILLFSNPATVTPTMDRLRSHALAWGVDPKIEVHVMEGAFALLMENKQEAYREAVYNELVRLSEVNSDMPVSVAQLSMAPVANQFTQKTGIPVSHPLLHLVSELIQKLHLEKKEESIGQTL
ncbi:hypothetical protein [Brevibacillus sp. NRS-1366]|uniref:hypothetical protein n=1 Tax=Brevibacillus sp. NRS-1366 TaxID=3233899 RepID=UPI003D1F75CA